MAKLLGGGPGVLTAHRNAMKARILPVGLCFWYATKLIFEETGAAWSGRFVGFSASYFVFPILTWALLHESMLTAKTLTCVFLSCLILGVQLFWK